MSEPVAMQFENITQQNEAATLGIWIFLATEVLFFGGLFLAYTIYRFAYPIGFTLAARKLDVTIGTVNTAILLTSSFFMALAVETSRADRLLRSSVYMLITVILGVSFLALKVKEYSDDFTQSLVPSVRVAIHGEHAAAARLFYFIYYAMTGLHAFHIIIGIGLISVLSIRAFHRAIRLPHQSFHTPVRIVGLYWHFVDAVWIFLYPLLYLLERRP
jgi:cytochrome c oxidase subunit 3